jgi:Holliday junction resolvasome RuvABC endonuclease subunit
MKILGLDLSLTSTGYCFDGETGVISTNFFGVERLSAVNEDISNLLVANKIDCVLLEGYSFASRSGQAFSIGELGGVIRLTIHNLGLKLIEIPPTCRAKFATGKGNASKNEVISAVSAKTGIVWGNPGADDKCDAWILEEMGLAYLGKPRYSWPEANLSALEKIDWTSIEGNKADGQV